MNILLNWIKPNLKFWLNFWIEFSGKKDYWIMFWIEYSWKNYIEYSFELNLTLKWMNESYFESIFAIFDEKSPFFCLFWTLFGQFSGTFPIRPVLIIPWLLNWIIFWIESPEFILNWIIFWIESWVKQYWIEYWMNHFLAKFKYWIESDRVSNTPNLKPTTTSGHFKLQAPI